jgi:hypothetical protein
MMLLAQAGCVPATGAPPAEGAAALAGSLPRELAPGIMALEAVPVQGEVVLRMIVAADRPLPDAAGLARLACTGLPLAEVLAADGPVRLELRGRTLARIESCPGAP